MLIDDDCCDSSLFAQGQGRVTAGFSLTSANFGLYVCVDTVWGLTVNSGERENVDNKNANELAGCWPLLVDVVA